MSGRETSHILILGGTADAAALAGSLLARWGEAVQVTTSLAGRTAAPAAVPGQRRVGGFGGPEAMARYLTEDGIAAVIDATHPFAAQISAHAATACAAAGVPRLLLDRPPWEPEEGDRWHMVPNVAAAAQVLPALGRRAFLTVGRTELEPFAACRAVWFLVRLVDPPEAPLPLAASEVVVARGPFGLPEERALMARHEIDILVCKASGGEMTRAKLDAARALECPVLMVARPPVPDGPRVDSVAAAIDWLGELMT